MRKQIKIKKLEPTAEIPKRMTGGAAGYDIFALEDTEFPSGKTIKVRTGISVEIPRGYYIQVQPRSSIVNSGIIMPNSPGIIDEDYRGEIFVPFMKLDQGSIQIYGNVVIPAGTRIAQMILLEYHEMEFKEEDDLTKTSRGDGGFGSTDDSKDSDDSDNSEYFDEGRGL